MKVLKFVFQYWPTLAVVLLILFLSLANFSNRDLPDMEIPYMDKIAHFCMYAGLVVVFGFDTYRSSFLYRHRNRIVLYGWFCAILFGGGVEFIQGHMTDYRSEDLMDFLANSAGATFGLLFVYLAVKPLIERYLLSRDRA